MHFRPQILGGTNEESFDTGQFESLETWYDVPVSDDTGTFLWYRTIVLTDTVVYVHVLVSTDTVSEFQVTKSYSFSLLIIYESGWPKMLVGQRSHSSTPTRLRHKIVRLEPQ